MDAGADLELVCTCLAPDPRAPRLDVDDLVDDFAGCEQLAVVVAAIDARDGSVAVSPDVNGVVRDVPR